jgi:hypothetical protein
MGLTLTLRYSWLHQLSRRLDHGRPPHGCNPCHDFRRGRGRSRAAEELETVRKDSQKMAMTKTVGGEQ